MKAVYVIIIFLVFFNIFAFMFGWFGMFPYEYDPDSGSFGSNVNTTGGVSSSDIVLGDISGHDDPFDMAMSIFFGDLEGVGGLLSSLAILSLAGIAAWLTKSPAPFVVGFLGNMMKNTYLNSYDVFQQFPINNYLWLAMLIGMLLLFLVTVAETLTHGDA